MTKQEHIEEIAKVIPEKIKDPLDNSRYIVFGKSLKREIARIYYDAGYRKIDDDCAVITKDELKQYKAQAVKEFAEKVKMAFLYEFDEIIPSIMLDKIDELLKE